MMFMLSSRRRMDSGGSGRWGVSVVGLRYFVQTLELSSMGTASDASSLQMPKHLAWLWELRRHPTAACGWLRAGA
jgi:hypothetical protein